MNFAGKIMVKVAEMTDGFILWRDFLIVAENLEEETENAEAEAQETERAETEETNLNALRLYRIEKPLTNNEIKAIRRNVEKGIEMVSSKLKERAPIVIKADRLYIDDVLIIQTKDEGAAIIGEMHE